jgi:molybdate/tungstate transport system substrate-binding protein
VRKRSLPATIAILCLFAAWPAGSLESDAAVSGQLVIFHAGSLAVPFREIADAFTEAYPGVTVVCEIDGSRTCARKIADLGKRCDVFASADYTIIDHLLIPDHADWNIKFATNEISIAYHEGSWRADEITADNWFDVLMDARVRFGRSDPDSDPCGYRTVLMMKLAERHYGHEGLAERLLAKDREYVRPKSADLLALLEFGEIDYVFLYRSVADQHDLRSVVLPDEINLKNPEYADLYGTVTAEISGKAPGTTITKVGQPMVYGVTIPSTAENRGAALAFVAFLLDEKKGGAIMAKHGQPSAVLSETDTFDKLPDSLKRYARGRRE